jgi:hypothetical protein
MALTALHRSLKLFLSLIFIHNISFAQFAPQGAVWHYSLQPPGPPFWNYPVILEANGTQVINGITCTVITEAPGYNSCAPFTVHYIYESGNVVYVYNSYDSLFYKLYDFNLVPGDTFSLNYSNWGPTVIRIDSVSTINILGQQRIIQYVSDSTYGQMPLDFYGPFIEGIGSANFLFPQIGVCDPHAGGLRCYADPVIGLYQTGSTPSCDTSLLTAIAEAHMEFLSIIPNPAADHFNIEIETASPGLLTLCNIAGVELRKIPFSSRSVIVECVGMPSGVYLLNIEFENYRTQRKLILY